MVSALLAALAFAGAGAAAPAQTGCDTLMPGKLAAGPMRDITARDLIRLRNVGPPDASDAFTQTPLAVSPDRRRVAFVVSQADPDSNGYCQALVVVELARPEAPRIVDRGGERIASRFPWRGAIVSDGWPAPVTPVWSPDGRSVGYLKRLAGVTQVWVAAADGTGAHDATRSTGDVAQWCWAPDGVSLIFTADIGAAAANRAIDQEGDRGWLYDDRLWLGMSMRPLPPADTDPPAFVAGRDGVRPARAEERVLLGEAAVSGVGAVSDVVDRRGWKARAEHVAVSPVSPRRITAITPQGRVIGCNAAACLDGAVALWWDGPSIVFLRREGWWHEQTAAYRWNPGSPTPRRLFQTTDVLLGCVLAGKLVCTSENTTTPRTVVAIDLTTARRTTLFTPNPEFARIRLGRVERLRTRNAFGLPAWGDLVLPPDDVPGTKLPMIVVQYRSRGFLRGGTGDEYPIFLFAAHGFAVLSTEAPNNIASTRPDLATFDQLNAFGMKDWTERRNVLSSLEAAVNAAVATGRIDPARIGITGLSDGTATVQFALVHSRRFAAAAISTCCLEPTTVMTQGTAWADVNRTLMGFPALTRPDPGFWAPISLRQNAAWIDTPILMQSADREYPTAIEAFMALREQHKPVEMYVYPDEYHTRVQPRHRLATYQRSLDWFSFWLTGREDPDPGKADQYRRWRALRAASLAPRQP